MSEDIADTQTADLWINFQHRYLVVRKTDKAVCSSTNDLGLDLSKDFVLVDTIGEDGIGPGVRRAIRAGWHKSDWYGVRP